MTKHLYLRLAAGNIKNNRRFYLPFLLTSLLTVACFFIMCSTGLSQTLPGGAVTKTIMVFGVIIIAIFSIIFLYYVNSFLIKRRKKELGLYNILGMEKRHIAKVLTWETLLSALIAIGGGLLAGILLDRLMYLLLLNILHLEVTMAYALQPSVVVITAVLFAGIFLLLLLANLVQVGRARPIDLLRGGEVGEKEPKVKWPLVVIGLLTLGGGYYLAVTTKSIAESLLVFFVAVILVIIGTYCLFLAGSIAVLKALKKNKKYYYKAKHFTSVSGMLYRMKQNAAGLANICILSTMVLVTVSTTVSLYGGMQEIMAYRYPHDTELHFYDAAPEFRELALDKLDEMTEQAGLEVEKLTHFESLTVALRMDGNLLTADNSDTDYSQGAYIQFFTPDGYEDLTGYRPQGLGEHEAAVYVQDGSLPGAFDLMGETYTVREWISEKPKSGELAAFLGNVFYIVLPDDAALQRVYAAQAEGYGDDASSIDWELAFTLSGSNEEKLAFARSYIDVFARGVTLSDGAVPEIYFYYSIRQNNIEQFYGLYGGFLFLGILLGLLFLMATVLIIYYKQIIEGYDDRNHFEIMQKVGMDQKLIQSSVHSQILTMFLLPLAVAAVHLAFAFPLLRRILLALGLNQVNVFFWCTLVTFAAFVVVYVLVYAVTARVYYRIVSGRETR